MTGLKDWSTTAANNTASPPYGAPENTTLVSDLNNIDREVMAQVRGFYEQPLWRNLGLAFQATGGANAVVLTGNVSTHFAAGQRVYVTDASTSQYATISNVSVATHTTLTVDITVTHPVSAMLTGPNPANDPLTVVHLQGIDGLETSLVGSATKLATAAAIAAATFKSVHHIVKSADETVNNSTTYQDDDELVFTNLPIGVYRFTILCKGVGDNSANFKWKFTRVNASISGSLVDDADIHQIDSGGINVTGGVFNINGVGLLVISNSTNTVQFTWAQSVLVAADTTVEANSFMIAERIS